MEARTVGDLVPGQRGLIIERRRRLGRQSVSVLVVEYPLYPTPPASGRVLNWIQHRSYPPQSAPIYDGDFRCASGLYNGTEKVYPLPSPDAGMTALTLRWSGTHQLVIPLVPDPSTSHRSELADPVPQAMRIPEKAQIERRARLRKAI